MGEHLRSKVVAGDLDAINCGSQVHFFGQGSSLKEWLVQAHWDMYKRLRNKQKNESHGIPGYREVKKNKDQEEAIWLGH